MSMRLPVFPLSLAVALAACSGPRQEPTPTSKVVDSGPLQSDHSFERLKLDPSGIGWVTGFRAEALDPGTGTRLEGEGSWHSDLRLDNGTRLLVATSQAPEVRFPAGFALPLEQILKDTPEAWRGAALIATASGPAGRPVKVRTTIEYLPATLPGGGSPNVKRLYVLSLPVTEEQQGDAAPRPQGEGDPVKDPAAHWGVPPGQGITRGKYSDIVPVDCTVHFGLAHLLDHAKYVRLTDTTDGKMLWEADPAPRPGTSQIASIPVYSSETGFPLYREHDYEIEVLYDNPGPSPVEAMAVLYLYYRPPGNEPFSYPYPPEDRAAIQGQQPN